LRKLESLETPTVETFLRFRLKLSSFTKRTKKNNHPLRHTSPTIKRNFTTRRLYVTSAPLWYRYQYAIDIYYQVILLFIVIIYTCWKQNN